MKLKQLLLIACFFLAPFSFAMAESAEDLYNQAEKEFEEGNRKKALDLLEESCKGDHSEACTHLYLFNKDYNRNIRVFDQGCDGGAMSACFWLGYAYEVGSQGLMRDDAQAAEIYEKACIRRGHLGSCVRLGLLYYDGHGVKKNRAKAFELLKRACNAGSGGACDHLRWKFKDGYR